MPVDGAAAHAEAPADVDGRTFARAGQGIIPFGEVERIARNHDVGEYRGGELRLRQFVPLGGRAYLGLDETHALVQILDLKDRVVAFPLAGERRVREFYLLERGPLIVLDETGELFVFERDLWARNPLVRIIAGRVLEFAGSTALLGAFAAATHGFFDLTNDEWFYSLATTAAASVTLPILRTLQIYSELNQRPDGLVPIGRRVAHFRRSEEVDQGRDLRLIGRDESVSLREIARDILGRESELFDVSCGATLARGIPFVGL